MHKTTRILIVDDDVSILHITSKLLKSAGYEISEASTGKEGLRLATEILPDLLILDVDLSDINGFEVCHHIKKDPELASIAVLMASHHKKETDYLIEGLEIGAHEYLVRPVPNQELLARVQAILRIKQAENDLKQYQDHLEELVEQRTAELKESNEKLQKEITLREQAEAQLLQSQKMESLGTLAGGIAHEFNNILAVMQGYNQLLLQKLPEDSKERQYVTYTHEAGERAVQLVKEILTFSRMEPHKYEIHSIQNLIKEALKMMRGTLPVTIDIQQNIDSDVSPILTDPIQMHQVLLNLCNNACHAMENTCGVLTVELQQETYEEDLFSKLKPGSYLKLTVSDTGCGIPSKDQGKIFDPFFTTKEVGKGTGLGLSIVHSIIEQHGGLITVESQVNKGATFHIYLPVAQGSVEEKPKEEITLFQGEGHILIVDDNVSITAVYEEILTDMGYKVTVFNNELDALQTFQQNPSQFDLVLTDYTMPRLTGDRFSMQLLKIRPDLPIIMATGYHKAISEERAKSIGIREFFMKPFDTDKLIHKIQTILEK
ncbi:MAG: response regulator [SAR324 cluster bacterium]|nr:response regulator [SAR324 cluster bacterium]